MANKPMNQPSRFVDWDHVINAIETTLTADKLIQKQLQSALDNWQTNIVYYRECCTVMAGGGRQNGKTDWIVTYADENTLIVTDGAHTSRSIEQRIRDGQPKGVPEPLVWSAGNRQAYPDRKFTKVMVDSASYVFRKWDINKFYKSLMPHVTPDTMFYLIG